MPFISRMTVVIHITVALLLLLMLPMYECYHFPVLPSWWHLNPYGYGKHATTKLSMCEPKSIVPDREIFKSFFLSSVDPETGGIDINQLRRHDDLNVMLNQGNIETPWLYQIWSDVAGVEATHVDEATAYEVSCSLHGNIFNNNVYHTSSFIHNWM